MPDTETTHSDDIEIKRPTLPINEILEKASKVNAEDDLIQLYTEIGSPTNAVIVNIFKNRKLEIQKNKKEAETKE